LKEAKRNANNLVSELVPFSFVEFEKRFILNNPLFKQKKSLEKTLSLNSQNDFDFTLFHKKFSILLQEESKPGTLRAYYLRSIKQLLIEGRIGNAMAFHSSYRSLIKFKGNVLLTQVNIIYLKEYEAKLKAANASKTTIGIYLRPLRTIFNDAINDGFIKRETQYPFGKRRYQIPTSRNIKKALQLSEVEMIYNYQCDPDNESEQRGKAFWLFSYLANGINVTDIARLKFKHIHGEYLVYERSKTETTVRTNPRPIVVFLTEDLLAIIDRWGNKDQSPDNFIFPILDHNMSPLRQWEVIQLFVSLVNEWMKRITEKLGLNKKVTTYVARHSFATVMKRCGASTEFIQESLGHTDLKTTENYLDSFENSVKKEFSKRLTSFKDQKQESNGIEL
jgi:integrase